MKKEIRVLELLASRICHDLISPIAAVNNGIEMLETFGEEAGPEVQELIASSAKQASAKLQVLRMAYGAGGSDSTIQVSDVRDAMARMFSLDGKISQNWDPSSVPANLDMPTGYCRVLTGTLLAASECLPRGGILSVEKTGENAVSIVAKGPNAFFREGFAETLDRSVDLELLHPKLVPVYIVSVLADAYGFALSMGGSDGESVSLNLSVAG